MIFRLHLLLLFFFCVENFWCFACIYYFFMFFFFLHLALFWCFCFVLFFLSLVFFVVIFCCFFLSAFCVFFQPCWSWNYSGAAVVESNSQYHCHHQQHQNNNNNSSYACSYCAQYVHFPLSSPAVSCCFLHIVCLLLLLYLCCTLLVVWYANGKWVFKFFNSIVNGMHKQWKKFSYGKVLLGFKHEVGWLLVDCMSKGFILWLPYNFFSQ